MTGSAVLATELPLTLQLFSTPKQADCLANSCLLVLSCPWDSRLTVALSVSQSLLTVPGGATTSVTVSYLSTGWTQQLSLWDEPAS